MGRLESLAKDKPGAVRTRGADGPFPMPCAHRGTKGRGGGQTQAQTGGHRTEFFMKGGASGGPASPLSASLTRSSSVDRLTPPAPHASVQELAMNRLGGKVGRDRRARRPRTGRPSGPALPASWSQCAFLESWRLSMNRTPVGQASSLSLEAGPRQARCLSHVGPALPGSWFHSVILDTSKLSMNRSPVGQASSLSPGPRQADACPWSLAQLVA